MPVLTSDSESTQNSASIWTFLTIFDVFVSMYDQKVCSGAKTGFAICEQQNAVQKNPIAPRENSGSKVLGVQRSDVFFILCAPLPL